MGLTFEWDESKARRNLEKHGVTFSEATTVFSDPLEITVYDEAHSLIEDRWHVIGLSSVGRVLVVTYTERNERIRIISSREATSRERDVYETQ